MNNASKFHKLVIKDEQGIEKYALVQKHKVSMQDLICATVYARIKRELPKFDFNFDSLEYDKDTDVWTINGNIRYENNE